MRTASCLNRNRGRAVRTLFRRRLRRLGFLLPPQPVDASDEQKDREGDNDEADDRVNKHAVIDAYGPGSLGLGWTGIRSSLHTMLQDEEKVGEVYPSQEQAGGWHEHIVDQALYDRAERAADDDSDSHINHVPSHRKLSELLQHLN